MTTEVFAQGHPAGANFNQVDNSASAEYKVGTCAMGSNGGQWMYVQASGSLAINSLVAIDEDFTARVATSALAGAGDKPGWPQVAIPDNSYGWAALDGSEINGLVAGSCAADTKLYVGSTGVTAGVLDDASATGRVTVQGAVAVTANSTSADAAVELKVTNPVFLDV